MSSEEKIEFIDNNKEIIKANMMNKIEYKNGLDSVVLILCIFLINENDIENTDEYESLNHLINSNNIGSTSTELSDIIGILKMFINKAYSGTEYERKLLKKLDEYNIISNCNKNNIHKTLKKALN